MSQAPTTITTVQKFSRRAVGFLWNKRNELDPGQVSIINALYNNRKKGDIEGQQTIQYKLSRSAAGALGYGRYYGTKGSLETLEKECRGTICKDYYHDIDIANCHPVLLSQYARKYGKDLPNNDYYIANRDKVLSIISSNREEAKEELIRILYGGTNKHEITGALSKEVREFSKFLSQQEEHKKLFEAVKNKDNIYGTFLSYILQTEERKCMLAMKESLEADGWIVDVLAYDGVMVRRCDLDLTKSMKGAEAAIKTVTGYEVNLVNKEFSYYEVPTHEEEITKGVSMSQYADMKASFEENHFYYAPGNTIVEVRPDNTLLMMPLNHALSYLNSQWAFQKSDKFGDYTPFLPIWNDDRSRKIIHRIDLAPSDDPNVYSMPLQWAYMKGVAPEEPSRYVDAFVSFINELIPDEKIREFTIEWFAQILQSPFKNSKACVILTGEKGCGKDTLGDFFSEWVFGREYSQNYTSTQQFWDKHDQGRLNKIFIKLEEAVGQLNRKHEAELKSIITSDSLTVNPKGLAPITTNNYNRFFMTTNEVSPVKLDEGERRFVIVSCSDSLVGNMDYWRGLRETLFNPTGARAVAEWLLSRQVGAFPRVLPRSARAQAIIEEEKSAEVRFLESDAWDGESISATGLYALYKSFCVNNSLPYRQSSKSFGMALIPYFEKGNLSKKHTENGTEYFLA
jgi:hypothetical protein